MNPRTVAVVAPVPFPKIDEKHGAESLRLRSRMRVLAVDRTRSPPSDVFGKNAEKAEQSEENIEQLQAKIGELTMEKDAPNIVNSH